MKYKYIFSLSNKKLRSNLIVSFSFLLVTLASQVSFADKDQWDATFSSIVDSCLAKSFAQTRCISFKGLPIIQPLGLWKSIKSDLPNPFGYRNAPSVKRFSENFGGKINDIFWNNSSAWALTLQFDPLNKDYELIKAIENDYQLVKDALSRKAEKEGLVDCQKVCLAKCVSKKLITYDEEQVSESYKNIYKSMKRGTGDCRDYSNIAFDLIKSMKLNATIVGGYSYKNAGGDSNQTPYLLRESLNDDYMHRVISVEIDNTNYHVEATDDDECSFYDSKFPNSEPDSDGKIPLDREYTDMEFLQGTDKNN